MRGSGNSIEMEFVNWRSLSKLLPYFMAYKGRILLALLCLVIAKIASVGLPFILKRIVDQLNQSAPIAAGNNLSLYLLIPLALLLAYGLVRFANVLFGELRDALFGRVTEAAMRRISYEVFRHLHSLDLAFHLNRRTGAVSRDIERGVNGINFLMRFMVFNIVPTILEVGFIVAMLLWQYSIWFALIVLLSVFIYIAFSVLVTEWRTAFIRQMNQAESQSSHRSVDSLLNYETVKYFNNEDYEARRYDDDLRVWQLARRKNRLTLFALNGGQALIITLAATSAMVLAAIKVAQDSMTIGDFVLINALMMQIFMPLNFLGFVYREMKGSMANIDAMMGLMAERPAVVETEDAPPLKVQQGEIEFANVSFSYQQKRTILKGVSFKVAAKQKLAIVGSSGSGKSTIMKLLFRFYDVGSGNIYIDGQAIDRVSLASLRQQIAVVPQETVLFNSSIFENIHYGNVNASEADVWQAIEMAYLNDFIQQLPDKEKTAVGERGLKLSGGEKQRVAIARAMLKKPAIMVFDEATSSLDSEAEQRILLAMERVRKDYTSIVIAHRLSTVVDADQIVVLHNGQIIEQGRHLQLLEQDGQYAKLWAMQDEA